ncbi:MAG: CRISPR-associated endonuclease Cas1 [Myxococcales bacterium]|nr:CRISPR-associated endonuclease Cas1 [Polyangiaceae bacterium]MDW8250202.1 CRISPR-associated endonuclease Cas1 [Myxococcales bacterium]
MTAPLDGRTLIVADPTLVLRLDGVRLLLQRQGKEVASVPIHELSQVVLQGPITVTGAALGALMEGGVDVSLLSSHGKLRGYVQPVESKNVFLLLAQVAYWNDLPRRMPFVRAVVAGKIAGQRRLLQRYAWNRGSSLCAQAAEDLEQLLARIEAAQDDEALRGLEGTAAARYFGVFGEMLSPPWTFPGRVRRPPTDPVNALLSLGYTLLGAEMGRFLMRRGFDLRIGLFHGLRYGRQSLPLDLIEEFRAPLVDRFVLKLLNLKQLNPTHFETLEGGAVRLNAEGRRIFYEGWEKLLMERAVRLPDGNEHADDPLELRAERGGLLSDPGTAVVTWRHRIERQVARFRRHLMKNVPYRPLIPWPNNKPQEEKEVS